jgi:hypothetical protein
MENRTDYNNASLVEIFLDRAGKFDNRIKDFHLQEFLNLIDAENGKRHSYLPTQAKQVESLRKKFTAAINVFIKQRISQDNFEKLKILLPQAQEAEHSSEFIIIANIGLEHTKSLIE